MAIQTLATHEAGTSIPGTPGGISYGAPAKPIPGTGIAVWTGAMPIEIPATPGYDTFGPPQYTPAPNPFFIPVAPPTPEPVTCAGCGGGGGTTVGGGGHGPSPIPIGGGGPNRFAPTESNNAAGQPIADVRNVPWWIWLLLAVGVWGLYGREKDK